MHRALYLLALLSQAASAQSGAYPSQPVKLVVLNPDAMQHSLVIVQPGALEEVGARIEFLPFLPGFSTTNLIARIRAALEEAVAAGNAG